MKQKQVTIGQENGSVTFYTSDAEWSPSAVGVTIKYKNGRMLLIPWHAIRWVEEDDV